MEDKVRMKIQFLLISTINITHRQDDHFNIVKSLCLAFIGSIESSFLDFTTLCLRFSEFFMQAGAESRNP